MPKKIIAALTAFAFLIQTIAFAAPELVQLSSLSKEVTPVKLDIQIPQELGEIQKMNPSSEGTGVIVHIQDAHGNYEAQQHIQGMIQHLHEKYGMRLLLLEGADEKLNPGLFHFFKDQKLNVKVADILMKHGEFTGPEMFLLTGEEKAKGYGIEKTELYRKDVELFRQVIRGADITKGFLESAGGRIQVLESRIFTNALRDFVKEWKKEQEEKSNLLNYINVLAKGAEIRLSLDLKDPVNQDAYPAILRVLKLKDLEAKLDVKKIEEEKKALLEAVKGKVDKGLYEALSGMEGSKRFDKQANPRFVLEKIHEKVKGLDFKKYPNFSKYAAYLVFQTEIESEELFKESKELTEKIFEALAKTKEEKKLLGLIKDELLLEKLFKLELSRKEYAEITGRKEAFDPEGFTNRIDGMENSSVILSGPKGLLRGAKNLNDLFTKALEFYRLAQEREQHFIEKAVQAMKEKNETKAVLVTGGFHAEGLEELVKAKGMSYVLVSPRIHEVKDTHEIYLNAMLGKTKLGAVELKEEVKQSAAEEAGKSQVMVATHLEPEERQVALWGGNEVSTRSGVRNQVIAEVRKAASLGEEKKAAPQEQKLQYRKLEKGFAIQGSSLGMAKNLALAIALPMLLLGANFVHAQKPNGVPEEIIKQWVQGEGVPGNFFRQLFRELEWEHFLRRSSSKPEILPEDLAARPRPINPVLNADHSNQTGTGQGEEPNVVPFSPPPASAYLQVVEFLSVQVESIARNLDEKQSQAVLESALKLYFQEHTKYLPSRFVVDVLINVFPNQVDYPTLSTVSEAIVMASQHNADYAAALREYVIRQTVPAPHVYVEESPLGLQEKTPGVTGKSLGADKKQILKQLPGRLTVSPDTMEQIAKRFGEEMDRGLKGEESSLAMYPAWVPMPTGKEQGTFVALDFGGTKVRAIKFKLNPDGAITVLKQNTEEGDGKRIPQRLKDATATAQELFAFFAQEVEKVVEPDEAINLGFTYSFGVNQTGIRSGIAAQMSKGFYTSGVEGQDPVKLLEKALSETEKTRNVKIAALVNDTVGTLAAAAWQEAAKGTGKTVSGGVILGTGTNDAMPLAAEEIPKLSEGTAKGVMAVNMEWGNFDGFPDTFLTRYDHAVDESDVRGWHVLEKMTSGKYLSEVARRIILDLMSGPKENRVLFKTRTGRIPHAFTHAYPRSGGFNAITMDAIARHRKEDFESGRLILQGLGIPAGDITPEDWHTVKKIVELVATRSARIIAAAIIASIKKQDPLLAASHIIAVDGSLYEKYPGYKQKLRKALNQLADRVFGEGSGKKIAVRLTKDGSGIGAAVIAAIASAQAQSLGDAEAEGLRSVPDIAGANFNPALVLGKDGYQINPEVTQGIVPKKAPAMDDFTNAEQIFYAGLSQGLKKRGSPIVPVYDPVKKLVQNVFSLSSEDEADLRSRKREPVTFKEQLWVLLEMGAFQFQIDDLQDQRWLVEQAWHFNHRNIDSGDPRLYPRLDQYKNPMGVMGFLSIEEVPAAQDKKEWKALIHITKGLWEELGMPADPAKEPIPSKAVHFLAQLVVHEAIEAFLGAQAGISAHRLASSMELFLASPDARARGVSDLNLWFLENGSPIYFQKVQGDYTVRKDPTVGAFEREMWKVARRKGYKLTLTEPVPPWRKVLGGDHAVLTAVGVDTLDEDQKYQLERDYGAKGERKAIVPQQTVAVPPKVIRWIKENKVGDTYETLLQLISAGEEQGNNRIVFVIDDNGKDLFYQLRENRGKRRPEIIAFLAQKKSEKQGEEGKAEGPIEIHITRATWNKMWEKWQKNHPGHDPQERPAFLAQVLIQVYIQNFLPRGIEGLDPAFWSGIQSLYFGTQRAKREWINDVQLFGLDEAANARNVRYLYNVFSQYRMMDDVQGNFRKIYFDTLYRIYDPKGDGSAEGNGFLIDAIENEMDLAIYYTFLFERVLKGAPHERLLELTPRLQAAKKNAVVKRNLDLKNNDFLFKLKVDEKGKVLQIHETLKGKPTIVYILQGVYAFLPFFFDMEVFENFKITHKEIVMLREQQTKLDEFKKEREEVNTRKAEVEAELLAGQLSAEEREELEVENERLLHRTEVLKDLIDKLQKLMDEKWGGRFPQALGVIDAMPLRITPEEENQVKKLESQVQEIIVQRDSLMRERDAAIKELLDNSGKSRADKQSIQFESRVIDDRGAPPRLKSKSETGTYDLNEVPQHFIQKASTFTPTVFEKAMSATDPVTGAPSGEVHSQEIHPEEAPGILELAAQYQIETVGRPIADVAVNLTRKLLEEILAAGEVTGHLRDLMSNPATANRLRPALYRIFSQRDVSVISDVHGTVEGARKVSEIVPNMELALNGDLVDRGPYLEMLLKLGDQFARQRTLGNHDMVSLAGFLGDISSFGEWLRWQLAYGNESLVTETYGLNLDGFKAYADQFYGHLKDIAPGNVLGNFPKKDQLKDFEAALRARGLLEEGASVPTRLGTIYAMAALNIHLKVKGNLVGLSKIPNGQIAIDPTLDTALVDRVRTQILPKVRQQDESTFKDRDLPAILSPSEIEDLRTYFRLSQQEKDMVFELMVQIAQQKKPGMEQARKMLQGAKLYDILKIHPVLGQIDDAIEKVDPQWKKHPQVLLIHAGIPVTEKMELADLNGNALVIPEGGNARDTLLGYWDGMQDRLSRLYAAYEAVLSGDPATLGVRLRQYLTDYAEDLKFANELAMGYYSPLYLRNGIEDVLNIYAPSSPHIRDKKYEEVDAPIQHGRKDATSHVPQQYGQLIDKLGFDAVIVGHINTKKGRIEVYADGRMFNVDVKHTEKGGPSGGKDTSTGNGAALVVGRSITTVEVKAMSDGFYTAREKLEKELMALKEEWYFIRGREIPAAVQARIAEVKGKIHDLDKALAPLDEIKQLNNQINELHRRMAEITDRPFAEWLRRQSSEIKKRKAEKARGNVGSRPDQVIVAIYGPAGTGKTVATGYVRDHIAVYLEDMGIVKNRGYDPTSPSGNTKYIANPAYKSARETPDVSVGIENLSYDPTLPEKDINPEYVWGVVGLRINFLGSDPHLYQGDGIRYIRVTQDGQTFRYSIITGPQIYKASEIQRLLRALVAEQETLAPDDPHAPYSPAGTTFSEDVLSGRRPIFGRELEMLLMDMTVYGLSSNLLQYVDEVVPALHVDETKRLSRRFYRDVIPKWAGGSRGENEIFILGEFARMQMREGLWYMLPMIRTMVENKGRANIWLHDTNQMAVIRRKSDGAVTPVQAVAQSLGAAGESLIPLPEIIDQLRNEIGDALDRLYIDFPANPANDLAGELRAAKISLVDAILKLEAGEIKEAGGILRGLATDLELLKSNFGLTDWIRPGQSEDDLVGKIETVKKGIVTVISSLALAASLGDKKKPEPVKARSLGTEWSRAALAGVVSLGTSFVSLFQGKPQPARRRSPSVLLGPERLEDRSLLSGGPLQQFEPLPFMLEPPALVGSPVAGENNTSNFSQSARMAPATAATGEVRPEVTAVPPNPYYLVPAEIHPFQQVSTTDGDNLALYKVNGNTTMEIIPNGGVALHYGWPGNENSKIYPNPQGGTSLVFFGTPSSTILGWNQGRNELVRLKVPDAGFSSDPAYGKEYLVQSVKYESAQVAVVSKANGESYRIILGEIQPTPVTPGAIDVTAEVNYRQPEALRVSGFRDLASGRTATGDVITVYDVSGNRTLVVRETGGPEIAYDFGAGIEKTAVYPNPYVGKTVILSGKTSGLIFVWDETRNLLGSFKLDTVDIFNPDTVSEITYEQDGHIVIKMRADITKVYRIAVTDGPVVTLTATGQAARAMSAERLVPATQGEGESVAGIPSDAVQTNGNSNIYYTIRPTSAQAGAGKTLTVYEVRDNQVVTTRELLHDANVAPVVNASQDGVVIYGYGNATLAAHNLRTNKTKVDDILGIPEKIQFSANGKYAQVDTNSDFLTAVRLSDLQIGVNPFRPDEEEMTVQSGPYTYTIKNEAPTGRVLIARNAGGYISNAQFHLPLEHLAITGLAALSDGIYYVSDAGEKPVIYFVSFNSIFANQPAVQALLATVSNGAYFYKARLIPSSSEGTVYDVFKVEDGRLRVVAKVSKQSANIQGNYTVAVGVPDASPDGKYVIAGQVSQSFYTGHVIQTQTIVVVNTDTGARGRSIKLVERDNQPFTNEELPDIRFKEGSSNVIQATYRNGAPTRFFNADTGQEIPALPEGYTRAASNPNFAFRVVDGINGNDTNFYRSLELLNLQSSQTYVVTYVQKTSSREFKDVDVSSDGTHATFKVTDAQGNVVASYYYDLTDRTLWTKAKSNEKFGFRTDAPRVYGLYLYLRNLETGQVQQLAFASIESYGDQVFNKRDVSPDGEYVAFSTIPRNAQVQRIDNPEAKINIGIEYGLSQITWTTLPSGDKAVVLRSLSQKDTTINLHTLNIPTLPSEFKRATTTDGQYLIAFSKFEGGSYTNYYAQVFSARTGKFEGTGGYTFSFENPTRDIPNLHEGTNYRYDPTTQELKADVNGHEKKVTLEGAKPPAATSGITFRVPERAGVDVLRVQDADQGSFEAVYPDGTLTNQNIRYVGDTIIVDLGNGKVDLITNVQASFFGQLERGHLVLEGAKVMTVGIFPNELIEVKVRKADGSIEASLIDVRASRIISSYASDEGLGAIPPDVLKSTLLATAGTPEGTVEIRYFQQVGNVTPYIYLYNRADNNLFATYATHEINGFNEASEILGIKATSNDNQWAVLTNGSNTLLVVSLRRQDAVNHSFRGIAVTLPTPGRVTDADVINTNTIIVTQAGGERYKLDLTTDPITVTAVSQPAPIIIEKGGKQFIIDLQKHSAKVTAPNGAVTIYTDSVIVPRGEQVPDRSLSRIVSFRDADGMQKIVYGHLYQKLNPNGRLVSQSTPLRIQDEDVTVRINLKSRTARFTYEDGQVKIYQNVSVVKEGGYLKPNQPLIHHYTDPKTGQAFSVYGRLRISRPLRADLVDEVFSDLFRLPLGSDLFDLQHILSDRPTGRHRHTGASLGQEQKEANAQVLSYSQISGRALPESILNVAHDVTLDVYNLDGAAAVVINYYRERLGLVRQPGAEQASSEAIQAANEGILKTKDIFEQLEIIPPATRKPVILFVNEIFDTQNKELTPEQVAAMAKKIADGMNKGDLFVGVVEQAKNRLMAKLYEEAGKGQFRAKAIPQALLSDLALSSMTAKMDAVPVTLSSLTDAGDSGLKMNSMTRIRLNKKALGDAGMNLDWAVGLLEQIADNPEALRKLGLRPDNNGFWEAGAGFVALIEKVYAELKAQGKIAVAA